MPPLFFTNWKDTPFHCAYLECNEWFAASISTYLRRGPRGCFRSECCTWSKPVLTTVTLSDCKETRSRQAGSKRASAHIGGGEIRACN